MRRRHRRRRSVGTNSFRPLIRFAIRIAIVLAVVYFLVMKLFDFFDVGNPQTRTAATLFLEERGVITVSIDGGAAQRAEDQLRVYNGDRVSSAGNSHGTLLFFDGTRVRMDQSTDISIVESSLGRQHSTISMNLENGGMWIATPSTTTYTGSITRTVQTTSFKLDVPSRAEIAITPEAIRRPNGIEAVFGNRCRNTGSINRAHRCADWKKSYRSDEDVDLEDVSQSKSADDV